MTTIISSIFYLLAVMFNSCGETDNASSKNTFTLPHTVKIKVGNAPGSVEAADLNNDGFADLAVTSETDSSVTILLGNGKGDLIPATNSPFYAGSIPNDISVRDFNKDG